MNRSKLVRAAALGAMIMIALAAPTAADDSLQADVSFGYQTGDYGSTFDTDVYSLTTRVRWQFSRAEVRVSVPYFQLDSEGAVQIIGGQPTPVDDIPQIQIPGFPTPGPTSQTTSISGVGDAKVRGEYTVLQSAANLALVGEIKAPTADEQEGLGTGEFDYLGGAGLVLPLGRTNILADVSYTVVGDIDGYDYENVMAIGSGLAWTVGQNGQLFIYAESRNSPIDGEDDRRDVALGASKKFTKNYRLSGSVIKGLSDSSEDFGAALSFGRSF